MPDAPKVKARSAKKRVWLGLAGLVVAVGVVGSVIVFGWMIDETHFDRPDDEFDRLGTQVEKTPGVSVNWKERWVEAPTFSNPQSWIGLSVDETHLSDVLQAACGSEYADPVAWSIDVHTDGGNVVSLYSSAVPIGRADEARCPDFGFDAPALVGVVGRSMPGLNIQASIWDNGHLALVALEEEPGALSALLPLVDGAEGVRDAAGLDSHQSVEIDAAGLSLVIAPGERERYLVLLSALAGDHGVTSFWADREGDSSDGVEKLQIAAPETEHTAIADAILGSGLRIAQVPVRFIEPAR